MSVNDSSPQPNTALALTPPVPTHTHRESVSSGDVVEWGLEVDGGVDDDAIDRDPEAMLSQLTKINNGFVEIGYANHTVVLQSVAILNEAGVQPVKVTPIRDVANRLTTETTFDRSNIETSLSALYGDDGDDLGFVNREWASRGNAYDWFITDRGREVLGLLYELGIIETLAKSDITADIE